MTKLGKILVFFNLVFSLVVGALVVMDFTARTHYAKGMADVLKAIDVLEKSRNAYKSENDELLKKANDFNATLKDTAGKIVPMKDGQKPADVVVQGLTRYQELKRAADALIGKLEKERDDWKTKTEDARAAVTSAQQEVIRREGEVKQTRKALDSQVKENERLLVDIKKARDEMVRAKIQEQVAKDRLEQVKVDLDDYKDRLKRATSRTLASKRPPDNVEGLVKQVDRNGNLVTITIGSDAGLKKGHQLQVFRLGATPRYLGTVELIAVERNQAVGQLVGRVRFPIQKDDRVAASILGGG